MNLNARLDKLEATIRPHHQEHAGRIDLRYATDDELERLTPIAQRSEAGTGTEADAAEEWAIYDAIKQRMEAT
jgi:hypothetical protein